MKARKRTVIRLTFIVLLASYKETLEVLQGSPKNGFYNVGTYPLCALRVCAKYDVTAISSCQDILLSTLTYFHDVMFWWWNLAFWSNYWDHIWEHLLMTPFYFKEEFSHGMYMGSRSKDFKACRAPRAFINVIVLFPSCIIPFTLELYER